MSEFADFVATLGFPIAVTAFVLVRLDRTLKELTGVITKLCEKLDLK